MFRVIILLDGELTSQSQDFCKLLQVFFEDYPLIQTRSLVTVEERKMIYIAYDAVTTMFYGDVAQGDVHG